MKPSPSLVGACHPCRSKAHTNQFLHHCPQGDPCTSLYIPLHVLSWRNRSVNHACHRMDTPTWSDSVHACDSCRLSIGEGLVAPCAGFNGCPMEAALHISHLLSINSTNSLRVYATLDDPLGRKRQATFLMSWHSILHAKLPLYITCSSLTLVLERVREVFHPPYVRKLCPHPFNNKKAMRLMAQLIKFYKFYYLLYLNKRWLNSQ